MVDKRVIAALTTLALGFTTVNCSALELSGSKRSKSVKGGIPALSRTITEKTQTLNDKRTSYNIDVKYNDAKKSINGQETVKLTNTYNTDLKDLVFHLYPDSYGLLKTMPELGNIGYPKKLKKSMIGDINISSVKFGKHVKSYTQSKQVLKIHLNKPLKAGQSADVKIKFTVKIPYGWLRLAYYNNVIDLTNWYPILSIYNDKTGKWDENEYNPIGESNYSENSDYNVNLDVPKGMVAATTGVQTNHKKLSGREEYTFQSYNTRDFAIFMSNNYKVVSKKVGLIKVNSYYFNNKKAAIRMLNDACDTIKYCDEKFGKYPFKEYDIAETYLAGGDMEYPTITQMGCYSEKMSEKLTKKNINSFDAAVIHETFHQWWFSTVGNNEFKEACLDEGFTSYFTYYYIFKKFKMYKSDGIIEALPYTNQELLDKTLNQKKINITSVDKYKNNLSQYSEQIYEIVPGILASLNRKVGEDNFIKIFREYYNNNKFKIASIDDFYKAVGDVGGASVVSYIKNYFTDGKEK